jgi:hypothetical protein
MKIRDWFILDLNSRGLWPDQSEAVMAKAENDSLLMVMKGRWNDDTSDYPSQLLRTVGVSIDDITVAWIDANCPKHWARPMFLLSGTMDGDMARAAAYMSGDPEGKGNNETKDSDNSY